MLDNGLYKTPTGVFAVRDGVAYGIPNDAEGTRVFGADFFEQSQPVAESLIRTGPMGNYWDVFPANMPYVRGIPVLLIVIVAAALFLARD